MKLKKSVKKLFESFPSVDALYEDENGKLWVNKNTAKAQSQGGKVIIHKRGNPLKPKE